MEGEIRNFTLVWSTVLASLCYCHTMSKFISKGTPRLLAILPIVCLFLYLPLTLTTIHLGTTSAFFIAWLGNFKLLLFAFDKGPLSSNPPMALRHFILFSCLPIKPQDSQTNKIAHKSPLNYATKVVLLGSLVEVYKYEDYVPHKIILVLYCLHIYFALELLLALVAVLARAVARVELEPQFDEPYLTTSLQDFWGKRWNLMVTSILRPTVYDPVRSVSSRWIGRKWSPVPAVVATFLVSGAMHELLFYYTGRLKPTMEVTCFFLIHGIGLATEMALKRAVGGKIKLPPLVSGPLALGFVVVTGLWLFFPPVLRFDADVMAKSESAAFVEFVKSMASDISRNSSFHGIS